MLPKLPKLFSPSSADYVAGFNRVHLRQYIEPIFQRKADRCNNDETPVVLLKR